MKQVLPFLDVGAEIEGVVQEVLPHGQLIVSFSGDLARVQNATEIEFQVGDHIPLQVMNLRPLQLRFHSARHPSHFKKNGHYETSA